MERRRTGASIKSLLDFEAVRLHSFISEPVKLKFRRAASNFSKLLKLSCSSFVLKSLECRQFRYRIYKKALNVLID